MQNNKIQTKKTMNNYKNMPIIYYAHIIMLPLFTSGARQSSNKLLLGLHKSSIVMKEF